MLLLLHEALLTVAGQFDCTLHASEVCRRAPSSSILSLTYLGSFGGDEVAVDRVWGEDMGS